MNRKAIFDLAGKQGLLPPFNHVESDAAKKILDAIYAGGLRIIEFTNRSANALQVFSAMRKHADKHLPGLVLGIGTIMNEKQAKQFHKAGAEFIVSPVLTEEVGAYCDKHNLFWCPGSFSPTEIIQACEWGADLVKIFPAEIATPAFVKALHGPCPWVHVMPSGGVTLAEDNIRDWFNSGVHCIAIGSLLFSREIIQEGNYSLLEQRIDGLLNMIKQIRSSKLTVQ